MVPSDQVRSAANGSGHRTPCTSVDAGPEHPSPAALLEPRASVPGLVARRSPLRHAGRAVNPDPSRELAAVRGRRGCGRGDRADRARCAGAEASPPSRSLAVPDPSTAARSTAAHGHAAGTRRSRGDTPPTRTSLCAPPAPCPQPVTPKIWMPPSPMRSIPRLPALGGLSSLFGGWEATLLFGRDPAWLRDQPGADRRIGSVRSARPRPEICGFW